jgi:hypothetical protein
MTLRDAVAVNTNSAPGRHEGDDHFSFLRLLVDLLAASHMPNLSFVLHIFKSSHAVLLTLGNRNNSANSRRITHGCVRSHDHLSRSRPLDSPINTITNHLSHTSIKLRLRSIWTSLVTSSNRTKLHVIFQ